MSNLHERHPPMGSEKDIECQVTSLTSANEKDMISCFSSEEEDDLTKRVKFLLAEDEISFEQRKTVQKNSETEDSYSGSDFTNIKDPQLKMVDSSAAPDNSFNQLEISMASTSYYSIADIREKRTVDYDFKDRSCDTNTSHMNLGNAPIQSDISVRPKIPLRKSERKKDLKTNKEDLKESEMSLKSVSFSSSQTYEGNMKILGFMKSSGGATPLKSLEHPMYQPISDLPEKCRKHIPSAPIYIDSDVFDSNECSRFTTDIPFYSSEVLPHIRWYPYPSYKSSQDLKNASTQTSLKHSKEVGPSSKALIEFNKSFDDSTDATQHLHTSETVGLSPVNFFSMLPDDWQANADINLTSYRSHTEKAHEDGSPEEIFQSEKLRKNSDASQLLFQKRSNDYSIQQQEEQAQENIDFHDTGPGIATIEQEFNLNFTQEDAATQTSNCDCLNELKNELKKTLAKIIDDFVCPCHQRNRNQEEKNNSEKRKSKQRQTEKVSPSEKYDILFFNDDPETVVIANDSPLVFHTSLTSTLKKESERRLSKGDRRSVDEDEQKKTMIKLNKRHAHNFSRKITNNAIKRRVNYACNERILKQSSIHHC